MRLLGERGRARSRGTRRTHFRRHGDRRVRPSHTGCRRSHVLALPTVAASESRRDGSASGPALTSDVACGLRMRMAGSAPRCGTDLSAEPAARAHSRTVETASPRCARVWTDTKTKTNEQHATTVTGDRVAVGPARIDIPSTLCGAGAVYVRLPIRMHPRNFT